MELLTQELDMLRVNMSIATNRVTELEAEKDSFEEIRLQLADEVKRLNEEIDSLRENEVKLNHEHEEAISELQRQLSTEKQKRLDDFSSYEKKYMEIEVS